jgi:hypothetical protein
MIEVASFQRKITGPIACRPRDAISIVQLGATMPPAFMIRNRRAASERNWLRTITRLVRAKHFFVDEPISLAALEA